MCQVDIIEILLNWDDSETKFGYIIDMTIFIINNTNTNK